MCVLALLSLSLSVSIRFSRCIHRLMELRAFEREYCAVAACDSFWCTNLTPPYPHCSTELVALVVWSALYDFASCCLRWMVNGRRIHPVPLESIRDWRNSEESKIEGGELFQISCKFQEFVVIIEILAYDSRVPSICLPQDFVSLGWYPLESNHPRDDYPGSIDPAIRFNTTG